MRIRKILILLIAVFMLCTNAHASIIYDNGVPWLGDVSGGVYSDFDRGNQAADDFSLLPGASVIRDIHWWGVYFDDDYIADDDFTIRIYNNAVGAFLPEVNPVVYDVNVGAVPHNTTGDLFADIAPIYYYWLDVSPISLAPNTTYWLSIVNNTPNDPDDWFWFNSAPFAGPSASRTEDGQSWTPNDNKLAFYLTDDTVPEPATIFLLGGGLLGLGVFRKKFKK